ncbi:hypothetical protein [Bradyrhizobium sp. CCBAU 53415]|uniref:hypothetical protein n=1 Tax=Bradyrhizobium sp. CCBAU 53415 TaxID=1325119 RepID=UPI0029F7A16F|nr:hypothetical protein [Bradyrhizobium sp. CCBAU 53415]
MRAATAAGGDDENVAIVLTPTPALRRQPYAIRALAGCAQNDRIVIRLEGLATDFDTLLLAGRDCPAASGPRTALQQEDERGPPRLSPYTLKAFAVHPKASPCKCHKIAAPGSLCCIAG